jgi:hypothetical protein
MIFDNGAVVSFSVSGGDLRQSPWEVQVQEPNNNGDSGGAVLAFQASRIQGFDLHRASVM